jgi:integrase
MMEPRKPGQQNTPRSKWRQRGTGRIWPRGKQGILWIQYQDRNGGTVRESTGSTNKKYAEQCLRMRLSSVQLNQFHGLNVERKTVGDLVAELFTRRAGDMQISTHAWEERRWKLHLAPFFEHRNARQVDRATIARYIKQRRDEGASNASVNREIAILKTAYHECEGMPRPKFPKRLVENVRQNFLEDAEYDRIIEEAAKGELWLRLVLLLGANTGMRRSELLGLKVRNVDVLNKMLRLGLTKNGDPRTVPLADDETAMIAMLTAGKKPEDFVFTRADGEPVKDFRKTWANLTEAAGVPELLFHDLRRTGVRSLVRSGVSDTVAMAISGHRTADVFRRYNITSEKDLRHARELQAARRRSLEAQGQVQGQTAEEESDEAIN